MAELQLQFEPDVIRLQPPPEYPHSAEPPDLSSARRRRPSPCSTSGCDGRSSSRKRSSPAASLPAKKLFLDHLPEHLPLFRTASDPAPFRATAIPRPAPEGSPAEAAGSASASRSRPPLMPWPLRRADSDPIPSPPVAPKPLSASSGSASHELDKTPNSKASKMMSHWREFSLWMEDLIREEPSESENLTITETNSEDQNDEDAENFENITSKEEDCAAESVSVERDGELTNIHFKCGCGKGSHFLLADGNCFYKLI